MACLRGWLWRGVGSDDGEIREVATEVAAIGGGEAVAIDVGVGGDEKVWDEVFARTFLVAVLTEDGSGMTGGDPAGG